MTGIDGTRLKPKASLFVLLTGITFLLFLLDLSLGSVSIPLGQIGRILVGLAPQKTAWFRIVTVFRLPKALTAALAGAALAVSGLQMQTLFRNPLAGPSVLGISAGASLGVAIVVLAAATGIGAARFLEGLGLMGNVGIALAAGAGSGLVLLLILLVSRRISSVITLLILGILFGYAANAVVTILIHFSAAERVQTYLSWTFGSFAASTWRELRVFIPVILAGITVTLASSKPLNAFLLGETYARSMGLRIRRARFVLIATTSLLTGTVTAFCGPIAFLGVAVPHLCRSLFGTSDHRILLPTSVLIGACLALLADLIAQMPGSEVVLPLNAVTALIGAPVVIWVILSRRNIRETFAA